MKETVVKDGNRWTLYNKDGKAVFTGKTRVSCFRYAHENGIEVKSYQHGGK